MAEYLSPGVYVEEFNSRTRPMEGVETSIAGFIGMAQKGPVEGSPQLITSMGEFQRKYGGYLSEEEYGKYRFLAYAVEHFFLNGGSRCFVTRVSPKDAKCAVGNFTAGKYVIKFTAKNPGIWGNSIKIIITPTTGLALKETTDLEIDLEVRCDIIVETYEKISLNAFAPNFIEKKIKKSDLIIVEYIKGEQEGIIHSFEELSGDEEKNKIEVSFIGGSNGLVSDISSADFIGADNEPGKRTGIQSFLDNGIVSIMAVPGITDKNVQTALISHCENLGSRFAVLDIPKELKSVDDIINHKNLYNSSYGAMYHPWVEFYDQLEKRSIFMPPSGSVIGIYARTDNTRGVHKAPANEVIRGCTRLDCMFNQSEQDILSPKGINLIKSLPGQGIRVWGARTLSSDPKYKYVNVRRLLIFIEESIKVNTDWVLFEPNDEVLWARVSRTIDLFLSFLWREGLLVGTSPEEAFFVNVGRNTMTQEDIDNRYLICTIGISPIRPAEFEIFRIVKRTVEAE